MYSNNRCLICGISNFIIYIRFAHTIGERYLVGFIPLDDENRVILQEQLYGNISSSDYINAIFVEVIRLNATHSILIFLSRLHIAIGISTA